MIVFTNFSVGALSDKTLVRDLAHVTHAYFARDAEGRLTACEEESGKIHSGISRVNGIGAEELELWQTGNTDMPEAVPLNFAAPSPDDPILSEVVHRLREMYQPEQIYLFGSTARGESSPDSDYDLMVVVPDSTPASLRDSGRAYKAIWRLGVAIDVLVWTHSDFEERLHMKASLPSTIVREGRLLYAA